MPTDRAFIDTNVTTIDNFVTGLANDLADLEPITEAVLTETQVQDIIKAAQDLVTIVNIYGIDPTN